MKSRKLKFSMKDAASKKEPKGFILWCAITALVLSACSAQTKSGDETEKAKASPHSRTTAGCGSPNESAGSCGDVEGEMGLAFRWKDLGNTEKANHHFERCLEGGHPECLIERSRTLRAKAMDDRLPPKKREDLLREALNLANRALASDDYPRSSRPSEYREQRNEIVRELSSLRSK